MAIVSHFPGGGGDKTLNTLYLYSSSNLPIDDGEGNWRVKFLSSGTLTVAEDMLVDIFAVGGGGNGGDTTVNSSYGGGGGAGGYTTTTRNVKLEKGKTYTVTVGAATGASGLVDDEGVTLCEAAGGGNAINNYNGGNGGSGGGPGAFGSYTTGYPGSDGNHGTRTTHSTGQEVIVGGSGQGTTTREFGEENGDLYSGAGGGGATSPGKGNGVSRPGGTGGGGDGATSTIRATAGGENTGGGGGGGIGVTNYTAGAAGGSGIVIIRNARIQAA